MSKDIKCDIYDNLNYMPITLFAEKLKVGIIGGGNAALIKTKSFYNKNATIEVLALDFLEGFNNFNKVNVKLIRGCYNKDFIIDKHIVVIAINDEQIVKEIINSCNEYAKIFINSSNFKDGLAVMPVCREGKNIIASVNTKVGNPKGSILVANRINEVIEEYDDFIEFVGYIRNNVNLNKDRKLEVLNFTNSDDFKFFFFKEKAIVVLKLFYGEDMIKEIKGFR